MIVVCPKCKQKLHLPESVENIVLGCPKCKAQFRWNIQQGIVLDRGTSLYRKAKWRKYGKVIVSLIFVAIIGYFLFGQDKQILNQISKSSKNVLTHKSDRIEISYSDLIDTSVITHSGETVGKVISQLQNNPDSSHLKGLVQPYLEPFSHVCNDIVSYIKDAPPAPFINIIDYYPVGADQPAWVALFREGHYQLYFNDKTIRIFLKGRKPQSLFTSYHSVIRHPLRDIVQSYSNNYEIEVYAFENDYKNKKIELDINPYVTEISKINLAPSKAPLDIVSYEEFFKGSIVPEAIEIDDKNYLYFYGRRDKNQTMAGKPLSLADFAIVYRGVFHYNDNPPYISLDNHEDNRYAKVNFGGNLENTRVGSVVLESDKLFKTLASGIDPNTHKLIRDNISKHVKGFFTEDERSLMDKETGRSQIRYWFYPDEIATVTDGKIGAVEKYQFLADVERMDAKTKIGQPQRETIDHLNQNYEQYTNAFRSFRELNTVGRMMALANWLKASGIKEKVDLDALLSVTIPPFTTPKKTEKMLAVTSLSYANDEHLSLKNLRTKSKVFYLPRLVEVASATTTDDQFLDKASNYIEGLGKEEIYPKEYLYLTRELEQLESEIKQRESILESLEREITNRKSYINSYSSRYQIEEFNQKVDNYNKLATVHKSQVNEFNRQINKYNSKEISTYNITSIGGGIDLRPENMKRIRKSSEAIEIKRIKKISDGIKAGRELSIPEGWTRNIIKNGKDAYINKIERGQWEKKVMDGNNNMTSYHNKEGDSIWSYTNSALDQVKIKTVANNMVSETHYDKAQGLLIVKKSALPNAIQAQFMANDKVVVLKSIELGKQIKTTQPAWFPAN